MATASKDEHMLGPLDAKTALDTSVATKLNSPIMKKENS